MEWVFFFFFQAEDGIRDYKVTGVQTCALPISVRRQGGRGVLDPDDELTRVTAGDAEMHFALNEDQVAVRDMAREFAAEKIAPHALRWDEEKHFPVDLMREAAKLGMGGVYIKDDVGGSALTRFDAALIFEALAQGCPTVSAFISIHNMASWMIDAFGNDTQRKKWLPK